ncbi:hypothetical protein KEM55_005718, partial [Ascosphaera atra]
NCANLLAFNPLVHRYHAKAYFALQPLHLSDDKKTLTLRFFWLNQDEEYARDPNYRSEPELFRPEHIDARRARGPKTSTLLDHQADGFHTIVSGTKLELTTPDPEAMPLPDLRILEMQFQMQLLCAASCEGVIGTSDEPEPVQEDVLAYDAASDYSPWEYTMGFDSTTEGYWVNSEPE